MLNECCSFARALRINLPCVAMCIGVTQSYYFVARRGCRHFPTVKRCTDFSVLLVERVKTSRSRAANSRGRRLVADPHNSCTPPRACGVDLPGNSLGIGMAKPRNSVAGLYRTDFPTVEGFTGTPIDHLQVFKFLKMGAVAHSPRY